MDVIDFANSYVTFYLERQGNIARIQIDAACTIFDETSDSAQTYYLIAPCRGERMYQDGPLFQMPNYEFCGIWSHDEYMIMRTHWTSDGDNREYGANHDRFDRVTIDVRPFANPQPLSDPNQIVAATLANCPLVARTEVSDARRGLRAVLEYPVKTMNVNRNPLRFQVDTGPLALPDFAAETSKKIERFEIAHVVYHQFDTAEFILRKPTPVPESRAFVTDYAEVRIVPARNEFFGDGAA